MDVSKKEDSKAVGRFSIKKFASQSDFDEGTAYEDHAIGDNLLLNEGINELWNLVVGSGTAFNNANANLGVGDDDTAASASQTGLLGTATYKAMDGGFPTYGTNQKITFQSTFQSGDANNAWQEFTVANGSSNAATNLDRLVSDQGTKVAGQVWQLTLDITLS